ncbi:MAG: hypothetical protein JXA67_19865, partial [Micromonosporaceae bacterium]|nr:hypothetical protein [Micromonosporaceae bacterium]
MILRSVRRLVEDRPVLTTSLLVGLAMALAVGSLAGVLAAVGDSGSQAAWPPAYGSAEVEGCKTDPAQPKRQFRAMWITTVSNIDWPSRPGLD